MAPPKKPGKNEIPAPIIVKKITVVAGGHHGGAWKVAYADFVTAMMAFFLLMWLLGATTDGLLLGDIRGDSREDFARRGVNRRHNAYHSAVVSHQKCRTKTSVAGPEMRTLPREVQVMMTV